MGHWRSSNTCFFVCFLSFFQMVPPTHFLPSPYPHVLCGRGQAEYSNSPVGGRGHEHDMTSETSCIHLSGSAKNLDPLTETVCRFLGLFDIHYGIFSLFHTSIRYSTNETTCLRFCLSGLVDSAVG
uniref:Secreted protein n=1 Tax=Ascaris lumbricoides TaxID=6252 RepID=A0A0M3IVQ6_ASCLU